MTYAVRTILTIQDRTVILNGNCTGPQGVPGPAGPAGPVAIYIGPTPPLDTSLLWVDTSV